MLGLNEAFLLVAELHLCIAGMAALVPEFHGRPVVICAALRRENTGRFRGQEKSCDGGHAWCRPWSKVVLREQMNINQGVSQCSVFWLLWSSVTYISYIYVCVRVCRNNEDINGI